MDALEALTTRRSIRAYRDEAVDHALIEAVIADAATAPSTPVSGTRPWVFNVIEGAGRLADFGARAKAYAVAHNPGSPGYAWASRPDFSVFFDAPMAIVISGAETNTQALPEACRGGQNLMISAHARGLGTCWVGSPLLWLADAGVRAELGVPEGYVPQACFTLGWPREIPAQTTGVQRDPPTIIWS
jgi:nitroreductase